MGESSALQDDGDDNETQTTTTARRVKGGGKKVTQVTKREFLVEEPDEDRLHLPGLLDLSELEEHSIVRLRIHRKDPEEGMLGYLDDVNATEDEVKQRWGGSQYRIEGVDQRGKILAVRTLRIAGEPIFVGTTARIVYEKRMGTYTPPAGQQAPGMSPQEILAMTRQMDDDRRKAEREAETDRRREEDARRAREMAERREHEERMRKLELEAEDRRRKDENEREAKRRADDLEREERRRREAIEAETRAKQHMDTMMQMMRTSSEQALSAVKQQAGGGIMDAIKMITAIKTAFGDEGGPAAGEELGDPLSLLIKHGPEWLNGLGGAIGGTIREVRGQPPLPPQQNPAPQLPAAAPEGLTIPANSPLAGKLQELVGKIAAAGHNPEKVLVDLIDNVSATMDGRPAPHQPVAAPVVTPPPAAPVQAAPTATAEPAPGNIGNKSATPRATFSAEKTGRGSTRLSFS